MFLSFMKSDLNAKRITYLVVPVVCPEILQTIIGNSDHISISGAGELIDAGENITIFRDPVMTFC